MNVKEALVFAAMAFLLIVVSLGVSEMVSAYPGRMSAGISDTAAHGGHGNEPQGGITPPMPSAREPSPALDPLEAAADTGKPFTTKIRRGQTLSSILNRRGVKAAEIEFLNRSLDGVYDIRDIRPGRTLRLRLSRGQPARVQKLTYQIDAAHLLVVTRDGGVFQARRISFADQNHALEPLPESPPADSIISASGLTIPDILVPDWGERDQALVFLSTPPAKANQAAPRHRRMRRTSAHKKMFLQAPLRYKRISSGYSRSRRHPVYHVRRPHLGIDYAAPMGTAVRSVGQGTVVFVGWSGGFGRCVHIRHPYGYTTYYGHLSRYAKGVTVGKRVVQGRVIGYVGRSGVATGPHLDFRVSHRGRFINPLKLGTIKKPV